MIYLIYDFSVICAAVHTLKLYLVKYIKTTFLYLNTLQS